MGLGLGYLSCAEAKLRNPGAKSGMYHIRTAAREFEAFCEMDTDNGGWMKLLTMAGE